MYVSDLFDISQDMFGVGQESLFGLGQHGVLTASVTVNGKPEPGVETEVIFADGTTESGKTDATGIFSAPYDAKSEGTAIVRIIPPMDVEPDLGEDANRPVQVGAGAASVAWNLSAPGRKGIPTGVIIGGLLVVGIAGYFLLKK